MSVCFRFFAILIFIAFPLMAQIQPQTCWQCTPTTGCTFSGSADLEIVSIGEPNGDPNGLFPGHDFSVLVKVRNNSLYCSSPGFTVRLSYGGVQLGAAEVTERVSASSFVQLPVTGTVPQTSQSVALIDVDLVIGFTDPVLSNNSDDFLMEVSHGPYLVAEGVLTAKQGIFPTYYYYKARLRNLGDQSSCLNSEHIGIEKIDNVTGNVVFVVGNYGSPSLAPGAVTDYYVATSLSEECFYSGYTWRVTLTTNTGVAACKQPYAPQEAFSVPRVGMCP